MTRIQTRIAVVLEDDGPLTLRELGARIPGADDEEVRTAVLLMLNINTLAFSNDRKLSIR